jgi:hypothetical protein
MSHFCKWANLAAVGFVVLSGTNANAEEPLRSAVPLSQAVPKIETFAIPPKGFRASVATDKQRAKYGVPPPPQPNSGAAYTTWRKVFSLPLRFVVPRLRVSRSGAVGETNRSSAKPRLFEGSVNSNQIAGIVDTSSTGYTEAIASWMVPTPTANGSSLAGMEIWNSTSGGVDVGTSQSMSCSNSCPGPATYAATMRIDGSPYAMIIENFAVSSGDIMHLIFFQSGLGRIGLSVTLVDESQNTATEFDVAYTGPFTTVQFGVQLLNVFQPCQSRFVCGNVAPFSSPWSTWFWSMQVCGVVQGSWSCSGALDSSNSWSLLKLVDSNGINVLASVPELGTAPNLSQPGVSQTSDSWMLVVQGQEPLQAGDTPF